MNLTKLHIFGTRIKERLSLLLYNEVIKGKDMKNNKKNNKKNHTTDYDDFLNIIINNDENYYGENKSDIVRNLKVYEMLTSSRTTIHLQNMIDLGFLYSRKAATDFGSNIEYMLTDYAKEYFKNYSEEDINKYKENFNEKI